MGDEALARPVTSLRGVGDALADKLSKLGVSRVSDLLFLLPLRYEDRTRVHPMGRLQPGLRAVVEGEVALAEVAYRRRRTLLVSLQDGTGQLTLRFFHFSTQQVQRLHRGVRLRCYGELRRGPAGLEMVHPEYQLIPPTGATALPDTLTPVYPTTAGLQQQRVRGLVTQALAALREAPLEDVLTDSLQRGWPTLQDALLFLHSPPAGARLEELAQGLHPAQRRLAFEELLAQQLSVRAVRRRIRRDRAPVLAAGRPLAERFVRQLPFPLTGAQKRVTEEILADMNTGHPMLRLVQGDVGSGKTVVAAAAALAAVGCGYQAAVMAPTELLAEQHYRNFRQWLEPLAVEVIWLSGSARARLRAEAMQRLESGTALVAVGTHALFQERVHFGRLGLAIVDEQHRFGVHQRLALREKGESAGTGPHQLIMTATPIPRTLAMTAYADLDVSVVDELPPGRTPVRTVVMPDSRRSEVVARVRAAARAGSQAYWVCPLIEESEALEAQAAQSLYEQLCAALPGIAVGLVHGRMPAEEKESAMGRFKSGETALLVATTVIEVGVDVPRASLMIIENAERMGLSQLHQLRGRVGRGAEASNCVLLYRAPLSAAARARLKVMRESRDGFVIAQRDLELRGPGEVLGTRQTGVAAMRIAELVRDADLLPLVQRTAKAAAADPALARLLVRRWVGSAARYGSV